MSQGRWASDQAHLQNIPRRRTTDRRSQFRLAFAATRGDRSCPLWLRCLIAAVFLLSVARLLPRRFQRWAATRLAGIVIKRRMVAWIKAGEVLKGTTLSASEIRSIDTAVTIHRWLPNRRQRRASKSARKGRSDGRS